MCSPPQITDKKMTKERAADAARVQQLEKQVRVRVCGCSGGRGGGFITMSVNVPLRHWLLARI